MKVGKNRSWVLGSEGLGFILTVGLRWLRQTTGTGAPDVWRATAYGRRQRCGGGAGTDSGGFGFPFLQRLRRLRGCPFASSRGLCGFWRHSASKSSRLCAPPSRFGPSATARVGPEQPVSRPITALLQDFNRTRIVKERSSRLIPARILLLSARIQQPNRRRAHEDQRRTAQEARTG